MLRVCERSIPYAKRYRPSCRQRHLFTTPRLRSQASEEEEAEANTTPVKRKRGRPRKDAQSSPLKAAFENISASTTATTHISTPSNKKKPEQPSPKPPNLPPRLTPSNPNHHDLPTFLAHARTKNLSQTSNLYKGTIYEYTVAASLAKLNFHLVRTGRANDLGIDLAGHFYLPSPLQRSNEGNGLKVLVQCKALPPTPAMVRELEGSFAGAPAGWGGEGVLGLLVASGEATKGVRMAMRRSRWPLGVLQVDASGVVRQFLWNAVAEGVGLAGLGVAVVYGEDGARVGLTWMGEVWKGAGGRI